MSDTDIVLGALKPLGLLDELCVESIPELVRILPQYLGVEVPATVTNVVVGVQQPGDDRRNNLWVRLDNSGDFIGLYVYAQGQWRQVSPVPKEVFQVYGDSREVAPGYTLAGNFSGFTASQKAYFAAMSHWQNDTPNTWYDVFFVVYTGF